jgi:GntP family gluconate:H+ symporter
MVRKTGASSVAMTLCLSCGLYVAHVFIPPTPGPLAAAQALGLESNILLVIGIGVLCSVFPLLAGYGYARYIGRKIQPAKEVAGGLDPTKSYEELKAGFGKLPSGLSSLAPLVVPILLMALSSIVSMAHGTGMAAEVCRFLGTPIMALAVGAILAICQLFGSGKRAVFYTLTNDTLKTVGPILFVTAAGGVLGKVIASSDMVRFITEHADSFQRVGIFFPFLLAAVLKTAQGSSTVAITTTAGIVAPLMGALGFGTPFEAALVVVAIGAGSMTVSHANDSYFWVVTSFGELKVGDGYRTQTLLTLVIGLASMLEVFLLNLIL